jgi:hypothetical protein
MKTGLSIFLFIIIAGILASGYVTYALANVESAPYSVLKSDDNKRIEIRNYESIVLVSASMSGDGRNSAFRKLFKYIAGANQGEIEISMTAPVIMDNENLAKKGAEISMTAPVFTDKDTNMMSFVMPKEFTLETTPKPSDPDVIVSVIKDYKVAAIQFNGKLSDSNIKKNTEILNEWIFANGYNPTSSPVTASYNGPFTSPFLRRNEVFVEIR